MWMPSGSIKSIVKYTSLGLGERWAPIIFNTRSERYVPEYGVSPYCHYYWIGGSTNVSRGIVDFDDEYFPDYSGIGRRVSFCRLNILFSGKNIWNTLLLLSFCNSGINRVSMWLGYCNRFLIEVYDENLLYGQHIICEETPGTFHDTKSTVSRKE